MALLSFSEQTRWAAVSVLLFAGMALTVPVHAQETTTLGFELVEERLKALRGGDEAGALVLRTAYEETQAWLIQAAAHNQVASTFLNSLTTEPHREAEIQARLDAIAESDDPPIDIYADLSREALDSLLAESRSELRDLSITRDVLDRQLSARESNARVAQARLVELSERRRDLGDSFPTVEADATPSSLEASQWTLLAERLAIEAEQRALEAQLSSQIVRYRTRRAERAELSLRSERLSALIRVVEDRLVADREDVFQSYKLDIDEAEPEYTIATEILQGGIRYREHQSDLARLLKKTIAQRDGLERHIQRLTERFNTARRLVEFASDSEILGNVLLVHWHELDAYIVPDPTGEASRLIGDSVIARIGHEEELALLASANAYVRSLIEATGATPESVQPEVRRQLVDLARSSRAVLTDLIAVESNVIQALSELDARYRQLQSGLVEYRSYLGSLILWVPSHPSVLDLSFQDIPEQLSDLAEAFRDPDDLTPSLLVVSAWLLAGALVLSGRRIRIARAVLNGRIVRAREDSFLYTVGALLLTLLLAMSLPVLLVALGLWAAAVGTTGADATADALLSLVLLSYVLGLIAVSCEEFGLGRVHFGWPEWVCDVTERESRWMMRWWLPLAAITVFILNMESTYIDAAAGRLLVLLSLLLIAIRVYVGINSKSGAASHNVRSENRLRWTLLLILGVLTIWYLLGHVYSVNLVIKTVIATLWIGISLLIIQSMLMRWLRVAHRRLRFAELLAARQGEDPSASGEEEGEIALIDLSVETSQLLNTAIAAVALVLLASLWAPLLPVLNALDQVTLWTTSSIIDGDSVMSPITLQTLTVALFVGFITFYAARRLPALMELVLRSRVAKSTRYTTSTLLSYLIVSVGLIAILSTLGVKWEQLQWLVAALSVGVGFGLQEIVANFISGLIILFERPIRVGDIITVGENDGTVTRIRIRATTMRDWDGKELLVPNKEFITGRLLNWTLSDPVTRIVFDVGIAYGSDVEKALTLLDEVVKRQPDVLQDPPPSIIFKEFGDNALVISIRCFIESLEQRWPVITDLHRTIYSKFNAEGIVIAFPQRDVHLNSEKPIRIAFDERNDLSD